MARGNWRGYLHGRDLVSLKKYLYVFRPMLGCRWIERRLGPVPMEFDRLVRGTLGEPEVNAALQSLVERKQSGDELAVAPPVAVLSRFVEDELTRLAALNEAEDAQADAEELNRFFRRYALAA